MNVSSLKKFARNLGGKAVATAIRQNRLKKLVKKGLPAEMVPVVKFLIDGKLSEEIRNVRSKIEARRTQISTSGSGTPVPIYYSPRPGSVDMAGCDIVDVRPQHGELVDFSLEQVANTGKNAKWGTAMHLLAKNYNSENILELGSCVGLSAAYLASADCVKNLVTIEGSKELSGIALETLKPFKNARVINALFDDALDEYLPTMSGLIDLVYIDGHHEKMATLHYFERIFPHLRSGGVVIFDDIRWSQDMYDGWLELINNSKFAYACDLNILGVCTTRKNLTSTTIPEQWNTAQLIGRTSIGKPHGWKK